MAVGCTRVCGPSNWVWIVAKLGVGRGCNTGDAGTSATSSPVIVGVSSHERVCVTSIGSTSSAGTNPGLLRGKLPGRICSALILFSALFDAVSLRWAALAGSERPSVNQFGLGRLNKEDLSDAESSAGMNRLEDLVGGFGFCLGGILLGCVEG
jgi:hypothetical protein